MNIDVENGLPYVSMTLTHQGHVLLDSGSAGSIFATDSVSEIALHFKSHDEVSAQEARLFKKSA